VQIVPVSICSSRLRMCGFLPLNTPQGIDHNNVTLFCSFFSHCCLSLRRRVEHFNENPISASLFSTSWDTSRYRTALKIPIPFSTETFVTQTPVCVDAVFYVMRLSSCVCCTAAYTKMMTDDELGMKWFMFCFKALCQHFARPSQ
jgi:hypothetical protein